ncbi:MAG: acyl-CoA/acyl-ACP dehydrogenase [Burkholderiales bacterium]|nr:acyl-CoA/acyl-ACP dehydrogenase [Burkholderiales bacterium]
MNLDLTDEQRAWQAKAREFAREVIAPISLARDHLAGGHAPFDWDVVKRGSRLGFRTAVVAKERGGHGIDFVTQALVIAELAKGDSAIAKTFSQCWKWSHMMAAVCTPQQQERYLGAFIADDTYLLGHAGTEPNAGSDHRLPPEDDPRAGWKLKAERRGDEWILNGEKCFIANGGVARLYFVSTRTNPAVSQREGTTEFLVPLDTPGLRIGKIYNKSGWRFYQNGELIFEDARVPHANMVGRENGGFDLRTGTSAPFGDLELGANALGICDAAAEQAVRQCRSRWPGARYFRDNQTVQLQLSEMLMLAEALRSFVLRVAMEADERSARHHAINHLLLQNFAREAVQRVTALNLDIHGGAGAMEMDPGAEKLARDAVIWTHLAGDSVQRMKSVRRLKWN